MLETKQWDLWLAGVGIHRVPPGVLDHPHPSDDPLDFEPFGEPDGLATTQTRGGRPVSALSPDDKLWIATNQGLAMLDLPHLPSTDGKPAIYLEGVTVGRKSQPPGYELVLPAGTHHLELNFDAIEISSPEKIRLQYRLDSVDSEWLDAKAPAHAIYSNIPPGKHAFHIRACNRSGIWDRLGIVYYVTQQPYFYQTRAFLAATIAFGLLLIAGGYQFRLRQVVARMNMRLEERVTERTRIARDLHDTLLQTFSASLLGFQSVLKMLPARPQEAKRRVENAIEQASAAISEGRDAVQQLRVSGSGVGDLAQSISSFLDELRSNSAGENLPEFRVHAEGTPRDLSPMIRVEAYRIAAEALRNAIRYAGARQIEVEIRYDERLFQLRVRDDGKGIDPGILEQGRVPGHWGLHGMRERAKLLGGNLEVRSEINSGTEVDLTVPAVSAYSKSSSRWSNFWRSWRN
jgi:signal transduction histidine kinase